MLKKNPNERISAVEALNHPYFVEEDDSGEYQDSVSELNSKSYPNC